MKPGRMILSIVVVFLLLLVFSLVGALTFPALPSANSTMEAYLLDFLFLLLPVVILTLIAFFSAPEYEVLKILYKRSD